MSGSNLLELSTLFKPTANVLDGKGDQDGPLITYDGPPNSLK